MHRSLLTAKPIAKALGLAPEVWIDIHEHGGIFLDHGGHRGVIGYPGRTRSEIMAEFPDYVLSNDITEAGWWACERGMEDWPSCMGRAIKVATTLREWAASGRNVAIITHGGFMNVLLKALTNQLPANHVYYHHFNTAITRVDFRSDGAINLRYVNRFDHLPPDLIS
jgi:2,3-bisphosphoglycerate-dependent phosphoglycerate mutase/probable phosphoglycerate mutase